MTNTDTTTQSEPEKVERPIEEVLNDLIKAVADKRVAQMNARVDTTLYEEALFSELATYRSRAMNPVNQMSNGKYDVRDALDKLLDQIEDHGDRIRSTHARFEAINAEFTAHSKITPGIAAALNTFSAGYSTTMDHLEARGVEANEQAFNEDPRPLEELAAQIFNGKPPVN